MNKQSNFTAVASGIHTRIPLNRLIKSPRNVRKVPHSRDAIEAYAASIAAKGILQNLVVEPEFDEAKAATGRFFVTIGEGRRLAQCLRVECGEITDDELIPCVIDTVNDPHEISLDENVTREAMHPADQFDAFKKLNDNGMGAEDIAARFGVNDRVVKQRLRLAAASPRLMEAYRADQLTLDQLMAFCLTADHARQEAVFDRLTSWQREPHQIRRMMTETSIRGDDRRARFVGAEVYMAAGGQITRDLFTDGDDGYFEDGALLEQLATESLTAIAMEVMAAEGWKWGEGYVDFPYQAGMRRAFEKTVVLSAEDEAALNTAKAALLALSEEYEECDELPDDVDARMALCGLALAPVGERTLTGLVMLLSSNALKQAFLPYTLEGAFGQCLDAEEEGFDVGSVMCFETEDLMPEPNLLVPVLTYLFHRLESRFDGRPTLLVLDEAWVFLDNPLFAARIREWLKTLRKKNVSVVFATQSLADVVDSAIAPAIIESCPQRIFLPNDRAAEPQMRQAYDRMGLNGRQVEVIARATPKRQYYLQSRRGNRLFDLNLGPLALAVCATSGSDDQKLIDRLWSDFGPDGFGNGLINARGPAWARDLLPLFDIKIAG